VREERCRAAGRQGTREPGRQAEPRTQQNYVQPGRTCEPGSIRCSSKRECRTQAEAESTNCGAVRKEPREPARRHKRYGEV